MSSSLEQVLVEALGLSPSDRRELIRILSASLEDEADGADADVQDAWADEVRFRLEDYRAGRVQAVPGDEVFARLRKELKRDAASG